MKYDIITIGGATEDIAFYTREGILLNNKKDALRQKLLAFEYGAKIKVERAHSSFGGGAANTAVCFSRLGFKVTAIIAVGEDERGRKIISNLKQEKVDTSLVEKIRGKESGFSFLLTAPKNEHIVFSNRAANDELRIADHELRIMEKAKWIYLTSLSGKWPEVLKNIFSVRGAKVAWNPGHRQILAGVKTLGRYFKKTAVLIVNKDEATELAVSDKKFKNQSLTWLKDAKNLLKVLKSWGPTIVVVTNGKKGVDVYDGENFYHHDIVKEKKLVNTTGVGDAFGSSFIAGLELYRGDIEKAILLGLKNTASVVAAEGAQTGLLRRGEI